MARYRRLEIAAAGDAIGGAAFAFAGRATDSVVLLGIGIALIALAGTLYIASLFVGEDER